MSSETSNAIRTIAEESDLPSLQRKFLTTLLSLQNVERGSIWVKREGGYLCVEAMGSQSEMVRGVTVSACRPSIVGWVIENGRMTIAEAGKDSRHFTKIESNLSVKSTLILCFPLFLKNGDVYGAVQVIDTVSGGSRLNLNKDYLKLLQNVVDIGSVALVNSLAYTDKVQENLRLKESLDAVREGVIVSNSASVLEVIELAGNYAQTDFPVFITGESGTGKELIAREVHRTSRRKDKPFLTQNCSAIPDTLLESELFGYVKGAFTGASMEFESPRHAVIGKMLGTADLLAQMADSDYPDKLSHLYNEFVEGNVPGFKSESDLVEKTPSFHENVLKRFADDFGSVDKYMALHCKAYFNIDHDAYKEAIEENIRIIKRMCIIRNVRAVT